MWELVTPLAGVISPGLQNFQCVVGESVTKNHRCLVAIQLQEGEFLQKGLE